MKIHTHTHFEIQKSKLRTWKKQIDFLDFVALENRSSTFQCVNVYLLTEERKPNSSQLQSMKNTADVHAITLHT